MTHREARQSFGSRTHRRANTKTKVIPGGNNTKKAPKYKKRRASKNKESLQSKVWKKVLASQKVAQ